MGAAMRTHDWRVTLGPPESWPASLKPVVALMLASSQPMFILWGEDHILLHNDAYISLLGNRHAGALGCRFYDVWPEARALVDPCVVAAYAGEPVYVSDLKSMLDRGDGLQEAHFAYSYTPLRDPDGRVEGLFCACLETTDTILENRTAEEDLVRLAQMFEQAPGFICMIEGPEHRFKLSNLAHRRLFNQRIVIGKTVSEVLPEMEAQGYMSLLDEVYRTGEPYHAEGKPIQVERWPGGPVDERILELVFQPVTNARGEVTGIFVEGSDITDRFEAFAALEKSEQDLRIALEAGRFGTWAMDFETHVFTCSGTHLINYGLSPTATPTFDELRASIHPDDLAMREATLNACIANRGDYRIEYRTITPTGDVRWISLTAQIHYGVDGDILSMAGVSADITAHKKLEAELLSLNGDLERRVEERTAELLVAQAALRQAQKMEAVGQLTGGIAHDFNNLLMGISSSLELLETRIGQGRLETVSRYVEAAQGATKRAAALTQRLLAFSRRQTLDPRPVDLNKLVADMEELIGRTVGPDIEMDVVSDPALWLTLIDSHQFENALLNLCINARDAMPDGGLLTIETSNKVVEMRTSAGWELPAGQYTCLSVTDTGAGMSPEVMARAFDPFFTTKPMGQGTGLGLSMIYGFVRQSGGEVRIYSEVSRGTTMCIYLPQYAGAAQTRDVLAPVEGKLGGHGETVLVVDDEAIVRTLISEVLQDAGYRTIEVEDGHAGLHVLESDIVIDLLITDVGLPGGMNGRQVADAGRVLRPDLKVLFITGYAENAVVRNGRLDEGMEIITKPFSVGALGGKIRTLIGS